MTNLEKLPESRVLEVLDFIEFISMRIRQSSSEKPEATDKEVLRAIESSGALDFYYDDSQDVYSIEDGEPL